MKSLDTSQILQKESNRPQNNNSYNNNKNSDKDNILLEDPKTNSNTEDYQPFKKCDTIDFAHKKSESINFEEDFVEENRLSVGSSKQISSYKGEDSDGFDKTQSSNKEI